MTAAARILIVDDSRIFRAALETAVSSEPDLAVAGSVYNGEKALEFIRAAPPDLVTLDVEMPGMGGLETLAAIQKFNANRPPAQEIGVVMVSAFTRHGADVTVRALQAGAFDFVTKPSAGNAEANAASLRSELVAKIRSFLVQRQRHARMREAAGGCCPPLVAAPVAERRAPTTAHPPIRAVALAASTGGPRALSQLLPDLTNRITVPILIVQHMPAEFTRSLAENLARNSKFTVTEAKDGQVIDTRSVLIAAGGRHLVVRIDSRGQLVAACNDQPHECGCRPSANVLFRSAAAALSGQVLAVVLTGMGNDGTAGLAPLKRSGGYVIAQDECTSVVWGMPGSAVQAGLVDAVLPLADIPAAVARVIRSRESPSA